MKRSHTIALLFVVLALFAGLALADYTGNTASDFEWWDDFEDQAAQNFTAQTHVIEFINESKGETWSLWFDDSDGPRINTTNSVIEYGGSGTKAEVYIQQYQEGVNSGNYFSFTAGREVRVSQRPSEWRDCDGTFDSGIGLANGEWRSVFIEFWANGTVHATVWNASNAIPSSPSVTMNGSCLNGDLWLSMKTKIDDMKVDEVGINAGVPPADGTLDPSAESDVNSAPQLTNPSPQGTTSSNPGSFQVDVSDADFPNDTVEWEIGFEGSVVDSGTLNSDGTVSATMPSDALDSGSHSWWANATDADGASTNQTFSYTNPQNVTIREERAPHDRIDNAQVAIFEDEITGPFLSNQTVTDGDIDLSAVPGGSDFTLLIESTGYHTRVVQLESIFAQGEVFLINNSVQTLQNRFIIQDNTGRFPPEETEIILQHAINQSLYDSGGFAWLDVSGDDLGASEEFVDNLTYEERYRVLVRNDEENETRVLGSHMVELVGTVELTIGTVSIDPAAVDQVGYAVNRTNRSGEPVRVHFDYNDSTDTTNEVWVKMFEYRNESNTLLANTSFNGPFGVLTVSQDVPSGENDTTWVVKAVAQRDGENVVIREIVGPRESVLGAMPAWLVTVIFMFSVWMVAGIFSQLNGDFGAIVVAGLGGMFWFVGLAPATLGAGVVILALITSAVLLVNERRDGGL